MAVTAVAIRSLAAIRTALGGVPVTDVKILSTGLAAGIIIDATIVRGVLAPALVALLGQANWWLPRPAARLLHVTPIAPWPAHGSLGRPAAPSPPPAGDVSIVADRERPAHEPGQGKPKLR